MSKATSGKKAAGASKIQSGYTPFISKGMRGKKRGGKTRK